MRKSRSGTTLAELLIGSVLFTIFMGVSVSLFSSVAKLVGKDQGPSEELMEARVASLRVCRRLRNCRAMVEPSMKNLILGSSEQLLLRDRVLSRTVRLNVEDGVLTETHYPLSYDPTEPTEVKPLKQLRLSSARSFKVTGGGVNQPTRLRVLLTLPDGREVSTVTNLREAL